MRIAIIAVLLSVLALVEANAAINYVHSYTRRDGTQVRGHYRDTSADGYEYNNANYLGLNERRRPQGYW